MSRRVLIEMADLRLALDLLERVELDRVRLSTQHLREAADRARGFRPGPFRDRCVAAADRALAQAVNDCEAEFGVRAFLDALRGAPPSDIDSERTQLADHLHEQAKDRRDEQA